MPSSPSSSYTPALDPAAAEVLGLTRRLLEAVASADWASYRELVAADITCFEPEALGQLVEGLAFHEFYFKLAGDSTQPAKPVTTTLASPRVRMLSPEVGMEARPLPPQQAGLIASDFRNASAAGRQKFRRMRSSSVRRPLRLRRSME